MLLGLQSDLTIRTRVRQRYGFWRQQRVFNSEVEHGAKKLHPSSGLRDEPWPARAFDARIERLELGDERFARAPVLEQRARPSVRNFRHPLGFGRRLGK